MKPIIAISMGDYNGIGPEVVIKAFAKIDTGKSVPCWIGSSSVLKYYSEKLNLPLRFSKVSEPSAAQDDRFQVFDPFKTSLNPAPGKISADAGRSAMMAVEEGVHLCMNKQCHALVTAPISKEAISLAGYQTPGHTEFLAEKTNTHHVVMLLVSEALRVALFTIHIPLKEVANQIRTEAIIRNAQILNHSLMYDFGITSPKIGVLGLNPHAGDGGVLGTEEIEIIKPVITSLREHGIRADGPFAADGYFGSHLCKNFDATLAMYHDQGLIPFKTLSFGRGVNFTAGLPVIRTSPDHGTAFSIAGKNRADEQSFLEAYNLAVWMAENRFFKK